MIYIPNILKIDTIFYRTLFKQRDKIGCGILGKDVYVHTSIDLPVMWDYVLYYYYYTNWN